MTLIGRAITAVSVFGVALIGASPLAAQSTYTWVGTTNGTWYTTTNWTGGPANTYPGTSTAPGAGNTGDIALFNNATTTTAVGIDCGVATPLTLGAINFQSGTGLTIGNSSTTTAGVLQLNGATVNSVANTLVAIGNTGADLTIAANLTSGNPALSLQLGTTNGVFNIYGDATPNTGIRSLNINTNITEATAGSGFTIQGGGNVTLGGTVANTLTGTVTVANGRLQITNTTGLRSTAGTTIVQSGGTLFLNAAMTFNDAVSFAGPGFTEPSVGFGAIRIANNNVTMNGTLTMTGNSGIFVTGSTTLLNAPIAESGGSRTLAFAGGGTLTMTAANTYSGATTVSQGLYNLAGANGSSVTPSFAVTAAGTVRMTNAAGANNTNRIPDTTTVALTNGTLDFNHNNTDTVNFTETVGGVTVSTYLNTVSASQAAAGQTSALTLASLTQANGGGVNFVGTGLGTNTQNQIFVTAAPTTDAGGLISGSNGSGWAMYNVTATTADFAGYSAANGVIPMVANTDTTGATWGTTSNLKFTTGTITVPATGQVNSLTLAQTAATTVNLNGFTGRIGSGGILVTGAFAATISGGTLTAGQTDNTAATLTVTAFTNTTTISANIVDNGTGSVGLTKLGNGLLVLSGTNTFTGPVLVTSSAAGNGLRLDSSTALGGSTSVTLRASPGGGQGTILNLNAPMTITGVTLNMESFLTGGVANNLTITGPTGVTARSALITNQNVTWAGPIVLTGNNFCEFYQSAANNTMTLSGSISEASPGAFTGIFLARGTGTGIVSMANATLNLPSGTLAVTDGVVMLLPTTSATVLGLNPENGNIRLGGNNLVPAATTLVLGQNGSGNLGQMWMNGFNQTFSLLTIQAGSTGAVASEIVQNGAGANSTLTISGSATPSVFAGLIQDGGTGTLALAVTQGRLTLSGPAGNTYTGGTSVSGGTLLVTNTSGSGTGTGTVALSGTGTLGGTGTISGPITVASGATLSPGATSVNAATLTAGNTVTFSSGSTFNVKLNGNTAGNGATNYDRLVLSGGSTLTLGNATLTGTLGYTPSAADQLFIITGAGSVSGTFNGIPQNGTVTLGGYTAKVSYTGLVGSNALTGGNDVVLFNFAPVPEPMLALAAAAVGLVTFRLTRRSIVCT
jgi:autotransporter-associated beta strand protein